MHITEGCREASYKIVQGLSTINQLSDPALLLHCGNPDACYLMVVVSFQLQPSVLCQKMCVQSHFYKYSICSACCSWSLDNISKLDVWQQFLRTGYVGIQLSNMRC